MKVEDTISTLQKLREANGDDWETVVEEGKKKERTEISLASDCFFMHSSIERQRRLLDEKRVKWIARKMDMITKETKERFQLEGEMGVEYRLNLQEVEKKPATKSLKEIEEMLGRERYFMELLLIYEVRRWEQLFWNKFKALLDKIGDDRVEEMERLKREWRANCWRRLDPQMHAALKRMADVDVSEDKDSFLETLGKQWALSISQFFEGVEFLSRQGSSFISVESFSIQRAYSISQIFEGDDNPDIMLPSDLRRLIEDEDEEVRLRVENEIEDIDFRWMRGFDSSLGPRGFGSSSALRGFDSSFGPRGFDSSLGLGQFDQFWDDNTLFKCRYSRSKWLDLRKHSSVPLEVYKHALKGNKNIIHITFFDMNPDFDVNQFLCDLPWVTSISLDRYATIPAVRRDLKPVFIKSTNNDLNTFAKEIKFELGPSSTYIFSNAGCFDVYSDKLGGNARVLISFVAPKSGKRLILRVKHCGEEDAPLEATLGSTKIQINASSKSSLTIDDITLCPIEISSPSRSDHLSFKPEVRNDIVIRFIGPDKFHRHFLRDIELLDEGGLEYMPRSFSASLSID